jgi:hypothetical protein
MSINYLRHQELATKSPALWELGSLCQCILYYTFGKITPCCETSFNDQPLRQFINLAFYSLLTLTV